MLREQLRGRRIVYTDAQRRRLANAAKKLGRKALRQLDAGIVHQSNEAWMLQVGRNLTDAMDGFSVSRAVAAIGCNARALA